MLTSSIKRNSRKSVSAGSPVPGKYDHLYREGMTPHQKQKIRRRVRREAKAK